MVDSKPSKWLSANYRLLLVGVLIIAAFLRLYALNNESPPGLEHDEVAHWLINREILNGEHGIYFSGAYGHEAAYHYLQTGFMLLLGDNAFALRLPSVFLGLLLIAVSFTLARRLFGLNTAVASAALLAVLFWPVFYSRLGLRAIALPVLSGLSAYFWWRGWSDYYNQPSHLSAGQKTMSGSKGGAVPNSNGAAMLWFALCGVFAGLSFYTYMASRVVPIFFALFLIYLILFHRSELRKRWQAVLLFIAIYLVVAAPLALYLLGNPGVEFRLSEINQPLNALMEGNIKPAADNLLNIIFMFGIRGDPLWRQNIAFLPVFEPVVALFFYIGVLISLIKWRKPRHVFILLWLITATLPSIVTIDAPSSIRMINALPVLTLFPLIGLEVIHFLGRFSTESLKLSPKKARIALLIALGTVFVFYIARTSWATFREWPKSEEVKFVWQEAFTGIAAYLDDNPSLHSAAIGGWTPESMDPPSMELALKREDVQIRYFDPIRGLILPLGGEAAENGVIARPTLLPMDSYLEEKLIAWGSEPEVIDSFTLYHLNSGLSIHPEKETETSFDNELLFLGYDALTPCEDLGEVASCELVSFWRVLETVKESRRIFLHVVDENGRIVDQDDGLAAPSEHWRAGDVILQRHSLEQTASDSVLRIGVYDPETAIRLITSHGAEFVEFRLEDGFG